MGRLTLRLPGTLHDQLADLAQREGVSLNQYIVYALTRQVTLTYTVQTLPEQAVAEQRASFKALLQGLGRADQSGAGRTGGGRTRGRAESRSRDAPAGTCGDRPTLTGPGGLPG
jgi:hypothetical protein